MNRTPMRFGWRCIALAAACALATACISPFTKPTDQGSPSAGTGPASLDVVLALVQEREKQYVEHFSGIERSISVALASAKELSQTASAAAATATLKAEASNEKRLDSVNEFRATLSDQQKTLLPRAEADARFASLLERVEVLQKKQDRFDGSTEGRTETRDDSRATWATALAVVAILVSIGLQFVPRGTRRS